MNINVDHQPLDIHNRNIVIFLDWAADGLSYMQMKKRKRGILSPISKYYLFVSAINK